MPDLKIGDRVGFATQEEIKRSKRKKRRKKKRRKFPPSKSVRAVSGGLPSLGKRHS